MALSPDSLDLAARQSLPRAAAPAAAPAAPAPAAPAPAAPPKLGQGVLDVLARLRGSAEGVTKEKRDLLNVAADKAVSEAEAEMQATLTSARAEHTASLQRVTAPAEAGLAEAKAMLVNFRQDAVRNGRLAAVSEARAAERDALGTANTWERNAVAFKQEADQRLKEASQVSTASAAAAAQAEALRSQWPMKEIQSGIASSEAANRTAIEMHSIAAATERIDTSADDDALETLEAAREAVAITQRAALAAREAVDQAAQNSAKLKMIRALIDRTQSAYASADAQDTQAAR